MGNSKSLLGCATSQPSASQQKTDTLPSAQDKQYENRRDSITSSVHSGCENDLNDLLDKVSDTSVSEIDEAQVEAEDETLQVVPGVGCDSDTGR